MIDELIRVHEESALVAPFTSRYGQLNVADGYAAALALHRHRLGRGWRVAGRKIGFTNRNLWPVYGIHEPMWGVVYDRTLIVADGQRASVSLAGLVQPRIEPEVCFRLRSTPGVTSDAAELLPCIDAVGHSVEIVQSHTGWKFELPDCVADNGLHGRLVVGALRPVQEFPELVEQLPEVEVVLRKGDAEVDRGVGANVLGSPLLALAYLVQVLAQQPDALPLQAGDIITTGVLTDAHPVAPGEVWHTAFTGLPLPGLTIAFE